MNEPDTLHYIKRETVCLELPLDKHTHIPHPERVILKISDTYYDFGARCYAHRSEKQRNPRQPQEVLAHSFLKNRPKQILQIIRSLSSLITDCGLSERTVCNYSWDIIHFLDCCDSNHLHDCLAGGEASRNAYKFWVTDTGERYRRQQFGADYHNRRLFYVAQVLEASTGIENLRRGILTPRHIRNPNGGAEPLALHDFAHAVALNESLFDGLCDLVLENRPFPYRLELPCSLGWSVNYLWLFPTNTWCWIPHLRGDAIRSNLGGVYDYENGRLATEEEIAHRHSHGSEAARRRAARKVIKRAKERLERGNSNAYDTWRFSMGMHALRAFLFLFHCNTGSTSQLILDLETEGNIDTVVQNQKFRAAKWRAGGKEVTLVVPVTFMPRLRRFMELRQYLLRGRTTRYLFFGCGNRNSTQPTPLVDNAMHIHYWKLLRKIDPQLPRMGPRALRASVDDYYLKNHDAVIAAAVMGHTVETEERQYARGASSDHHEEMTLFMASVSESARRQRVVPLQNVMSEAPSLEEGGHCEDFGRPEGLVIPPPVRPDCKDSQGCLFCNRRVLVAGEEDARKVASAAYVMEQLILGPKHEEALRPSIAKCDEDLARIAAFPGCASMVERVRVDVYENENLTPFWADKYQLFLELGIIS